MLRHLLNKNHSLPKALLSGILLLGGTTAAQAQSVTLFRSGVIVLPRFSSVADAIDAAMAGDSLVLSPHTFKEHDLNISMNLAFTGTSDTSGMSTIDAEYSGRCMLINSGNVLIKDLMLQNGKISNASGGGVCNYGSGSLTFSGNSAVNACSTSGTYAHGGGIFSAGKLNLLDNTSISNNVSEETGGGIYAYTTLLVAGHAQIVNNKTYGSGGGIFSVANGAANITDYAVISNNSADLTGGGLFGVGTISGHATISNNKADYGAGIAAFNDLLIIGDSVNINNNTATTAGAGIWLNNCSLYGNGYFNIKNNRIPATTGTLNYGGAIYNVNGSIFINGGTITGNQSPVAAIYSTSSSTATQINLHSAHLYNPNADGSRNTEVYLSPSLPSSSIVFTSDSCWWGSNDTSGLVINRPGTSSGTISSYAVLNWILNEGAPVDPLTSQFPLRAEFSLSDGSKMDSLRLRSIMGHFIANKGTFTPTVSAIDTDNNVLSLYTAPSTTDTIMITAYIDADTFYSGKIAVTGLGIAHKGTSQNIKIYPNPSSSYVYLQGASKGTIVRLFSLEGKNLLSFRTNEDTERIDISSFAPGNYIMEMHSGANERHSTIISKQ